ncbi:hypothetical protein [Cytobacillus sp. IB215665]|uniref:hypothetical protein n=1 Tax=Cytobacillus sp. IB215665 TaxID=3097357 RepID=UPI002A12D2BF|nr:hypothetical protein [Cytobacillus sp. IB215665]MDX8367204.1 hypothetical protein [Cytobacillus sp. IB215665]
MDQQEHDLEQALQQLEKTRVLLLTALMQYRFWHETSKETPSYHFERANISVKKTNDQVKLIMQGTLPYINEEHRQKDKNYYRTLSEFYVSEMTKAIENENIGIQFEKALVIIKQFYSDEKVRDFDNQYKTFIFNALRYSKVLLDDSWKKLTYIECGELDKEFPRTEIIVTNAEKLDNIMEKIT